jgi:TIR domain
MNKMPLLSKMTLRLLDTTKKWDYLILGLVCLAPSIFAWLLGIGDTVEIEGITYVGWFDKYNFWPFVFVQPLGLWLLRNAFIRVANVVPETVPDKPPPLVQLFRSSPSPQYAYDLLRDWLVSPRIMGGALLASLAIQVVDIRELFAVYQFGNEVRAGEFDWSVMYQAGLLGKSANAWFCVSAYFLQALITTMGLWGMAFLTAHNLFFLKSIYQRSRVNAGEEANYITLDLDDVDRCFGFRVANDSFNTQVVALSIAGVIILMSRFANVTSVEGLVTLDDILSGQLVRITFFPDIGQVLLALGWIVALIIITSPSLVKLAPRLPFLGAVSDLRIDSYLREFLTDDQWPYGEHPSENEINRMAAKFANNGFWPTGDNRASHLFFFSFWVLLVILYPINTKDMWLFVPSILLLGGIAYLLRTVLLKILNGSLSYVDDRLTIQRPDLLEGNVPSTVRIPGKLFISYRREDSLAYTRLLKQSLLQYIDDNRLFMDISGISDGEDFVQAIESAIGNCDYVIAVIGPTWASCTTESGQRRLEQGDDFVRLEIATAFAEGKTVVPVLVGGASMPTAEELTADIVPLWRRHARELSDTRWEYDTGELAKSLADKARP